MTPERAAHPLKPLPSLIFASRWLQLPLYLGLIVAAAPGGEALRRRP
jgi:uncharacterized membrane protein YqhA